MHTLHIIEESARPFPPHTGTGPLASADVAIVLGAAQLAALEPEWQHLWRQSEDASVFTSPGWLLAWWQQLGGGPLRVFTVRSSGRLVAILPMFIFSDAGLARLLPLGISVSDRFDLLAAPRWSAPAAEALAVRLRDPSSDWDRCKLHETPSDSPMRRFASASIVSERVPRARSTTVRGLAGSIRSTATLGACPPGSRTCRADTRSAGAGGARGPLPAACRPVGHPR